MDQNRILLIGPGTSHRSSRLIAATHLDEFNVVIWHPSTLLEEWKKFGLTEKTAKASEAQIAKLVAWAKRGNSLIIVDAPPSSFKFGYVAGTSSETKKYDPREADPFSGVQFTRAMGQLMELCGPDAAQDHMATMLPNLHYSAILQSKGLFPLLRVSRGRQGSDQLVGGFKRFDDGFIIYVPPVIDPDLYDHYHTILASLPECLSTGTQDVPAWVEDFQTNEEATARQKITQLEATIIENQKRISEQDAVVASAQSLKWLFAGSGDEFAGAVEKAFGELGVRVVKGPRHRADLLAYDGQRLAAIEAKGLEGGAKEANLRQTERWVADIRSALVATAEEKKADIDLASYSEKLIELGVPIGGEETTIECKGIMVIGGYRKTPISDRKEQVFPEPVARTINRSKVCALSGLQLLGLFLAAREDPRLTGKTIELLFSSNGVVNEATDWTKFLTSQS